MYKLIIRVDISHTQKQYYHVHYHDDQNPNSRTFLKCDKGLEYWVTRIIMQ